MDMSRRNAGEDVNIVQNLDTLVSGASLSPKRKIVKLLKLPRKRNRRRRRRRRKKKGQEEEGKENS